MKSVSVLTITRRDLRDAFSDWRILVPLFILAVFLPSLLQRALRFAIEFLDAPGLEQVLVPFGLLLVGFLPASFSLVGPLEAFVGERERNTLEALLATPLSNIQLYAGKVIATMIPPFMSSVVAMSIYTLLIKASGQYAAALTPGWIIIITGIVFIKVAAMITAALFISVKSASVRAANLLASLILLPMVFAIQIEAVSFLQRDFNTVALINISLAMGSIIFLWLGVRAFDRELVLAREHRSLRTDGTVLRARTSSRRYNALWTIIRREVSDTLSDWRILIPIIVLTIVMPLIATGATLALQISQATPTELQPIMPFFVLLVGFLPASFSLVIALEVFVGEKEHGTLESLLAMPISDAQLYLGKTLAALVTPLLASLGSMAIYYGTLQLFGASILLVRVTPTVFLGMIAISWVQALAMVTGAVVISSHTSSVRVANLMASFVVLPVTIAMQTEAILIIGRRYDLIWWIGCVMLVIALLLARGGMRSFHRESILSREHIPFNLEAIGQTWLAFFREIRPAGVDPDNLAKHVSLRRFYTQELRVVWQEIRKPLLLAGLFVMVALIYGTQFSPVSEREIWLSEGLINPARIDSIDTSTSWWAIWARNARNMFVAGLLSTVTFGFVGLLLPLFLFFRLAYAANVAAEYFPVQGAWGYVLGHVLPHSSLEYIAALILGALSLRIAASVVTVPPAYSIGRHLLWSTALFLKTWLFVLVPLLLCAALIETTITPLVFQMIYGN